VLFFQYVCAARTTILNVAVDFGAVGDARSEDTQAIQRAISEAQTVEWTTTIQFESSSRRSRVCICSLAYCISGCDYISILQIDATLTAITNETMSGSVEDVLVHDNIIGLCPAG
jgi:hypothetical protein